MLFCKLDVRPHVVWGCWWILFCELDDRVLGGYVVWGYCWILFCELVGSVLRA